ncbi:MAG: hypothetical protein NTX33_11950 [Propionibacteriales bacterium]|nr:hypothetical protein [Propionibacteriales bacterium]
MSQPDGDRQLWSTGSAVALATVWSLVPLYGDWFGSWGETTYAIDSSTTLAYPLLAGIAAWVASGPRRRRYAWLEVSAARTSFESALRAAARTALPAILGCLIVVAVAMMATGTEATYGKPQFVALAPVVAGFGSAACFGVLVGRLLPSALSPVAAVVSVFAIEVFVDIGNPSLQGFAGLAVADGRDRTFRFTETWMLELRALWLVALGWLFLALASRAASRWLVPFAAVCLLAVPLLVVGPAGLKVDEAAYEPVCREEAGDVTVCLSAARSHAADEVARAIGPVVVLLRGLQGDGWDFVEEDIADDPSFALRDDRLLIPFGVVHGNSSNAHVVDERMFQASLIESILPRCVDLSQNSQGKAYATIADAIQRWVLTELGIPTDGQTGYQFPNLSEYLYDYSKVSAFDERWVGLTSSERQDWFSIHGRALLGCGLTFLDGEER